MTKGEEPAVRVRRVAEDCLIDMVESTATAPPWVSTSPAMERSAVSVKTVSARRPIRLVGSASGATDRCNVPRRVDEGNIVVRVSVNVRSVVRRGECVDASVVRRDKRAGTGRAAIRVRTVDVVRTGRPARMRMAAANRSAPAGEAWWARRCGAVAAASDARAGSVVRRIARVAIPAVPTGNAASMGSVAMRPITAMAPVVVRIRLVKTGDVVPGVSRAIVVAVQESSASIQGCSPPIFAAM